MRFLLLIGYGSDRCDQYCNIPWVGLASACLTLHATGYSLDEFDNSDEDWYRTNDVIIRFYRKYNPSMSTEEVGSVCAVARTKGIRFLDQKLKKKYGQSVTEFSAEPVLNWRNRWNKVLIETHKEQLSYEVTLNSHCQNNTKRGTHLLVFS